MDQEKIILDLLEKVLDVPRDQQERVLAEASDGNVALQEAVRAHLTFQSCSWSHREQVAESLIRQRPTGLEAGDYLGSWRIVREIGRGGMGSVFLAERDDDVFRMQAAVKLAHHQPPSGAPLREWFSRERHILASLEHPNICRILDGGTCSDGRPYFVMEYVDGLPLHEYCRLNNLSGRRRLILLSKICDALAFAHQHLIIHRDLKPENIMVTTNGEPKLMDFGIAKVQVPDDETQTRFQRMTLAYASPEQVAGQRLTTQSDIYSLGVVLYQLLTGKRPFDFSHMDLLEIQTCLQETTPPKPSRVAADPEKARQLAGDLDHIILKALRPPQHRYATVENMKDDLERYLRGYPVSARKGNAAYVLHKFIKRHRLPVTAVMLIFLVSLGFGMALSKKHYQVITQRDRALMAEQKASQAVEFMLDTFDASSPYVTRDEDITARDLLENASRKITGIRDENMRAGFYLALGRAFRQLGHSDRADHILRQALPVGKRSRLEPLNRADLHAELGRVALDEGRFDDAGCYLGKASEVYRKHLPPDDPRLVSSLEDRAHLCMRTSQFSEAGPLLMSALSILENRPEPKPDMLSGVLNNMGRYYSGRGDLDAALAMHQRNLETKAEHWHWDSPMLLDTYNNIGNLYMDWGRFGEAVPFFEKAEAIAVNGLGEHHHVTLMSMNNLAELERRLGKSDQALERFRRVEDLAVKGLKPTHPLHGHLADNIGKILAVRKEYPKAGQYFRRAINLKTKTYGEEDFRLAGSYSNLGLVLKKENDMAGAETAYRKAITILEASLGVDHLALAPTLNNLARLYLDTNRSESALGYYRRSQAIAEKSGGSNHIYVATSLLGQARISKAENACEQALGLCERSLDIRQTAYGPENRYTKEAQAFLDSLQQCL